jgi:hypothetical protein
MSFPDQEKFQDSIQPIQSHTILTMLNSYQDTVRTLLGYTDYPGVSAEEFELFKNQFQSSVYTCRLKSCPRATLGLKSDKLRREHESTHIRRFRCDFSGCKYPPFGSAQALRNHAKKHHNVGSHRLSIRRKVSQMLVVSKAQLPKVALIDSKFPDENENIGSNLDSENYIYPERQNGPLFDMNEDWFEKNDGRVFRGYDLDDKLLRQERQAELFNLTKTRYPNQQQLRQQQLQQQQLQQQQLQQQQLQQQQLQQQQLQQQQLQQQQLQQQRLQQHRLQQRAQQEQEQTHPLQYQQLGQQKPQGEPKQLTQLQMRQLLVEQQKRMKSKQLQQVFKDSVSAPNTSTLSTLSGQMGTMLPTALLKQYPTLGDIWDTVPNPFNDQLEEEIDISGHGTWGSASDLEEEDKFWDGQVM